MRPIISIICICVHFLAWGQPPSASGAERVVQDDREPRLARVIDYKFRDPSFFDKVFSHAGVAPGNQVPFGRLEFIGDKVLGLAVSARLCSAYPDQGEGWLTQTLATLVSNENNARVADQLQLLDYAKINPVHMASGEGLQKIKADTCEALIGAIYMDGGQGSAEKFIFANWKIDASLSVKAPATAPLLAVVPNGVKGAAKGAAKKGVAKGGSTPFEVYRLAHKLPSHQFECLTKSDPFQVRICYGGQPFTETVQASTKSAAKKLAASRALEILQGCNFAAIRKGKSGAALLVLLQKQAIKPLGQASKSSATPALAAAKVPVASSVTLKTLSAFPDVISHKRSKQKLQELSQILQQGAPIYTLLSQPASGEKMARVTVGDTFAEATGKKAEKFAAKAMYHKLTDQTIAVKKAKEALQNLCEQRKLSAPIYNTTGKEGFKVKVAVGKFMAEADSSASQDHAKKLAAKKLYEVLRKTHNSKVF